MKKLIMILIITAFAATAFAEEIFTPKTGFLNVRSEPCTHAKVLKVVKEGDRLIFTGEKHDNAGNIWIKVKDAKNAVGWVSKKYTKQLSSGMADVAQKFLQPIAKVKAETEPTAGNITVVSGEGLHRVKVSLKDLNRITCDGRISDPVYSKDKQMEIVRGGEKDLFIKISPVQTTYNGVSEVSYGMFARELFVECMGTIHNFTLVPEDIATQTIAIRSEIHDIRKSRNAETAVPYETLVSELIKSAYNEQVPDGYNMEDGAISYRFSEMDMRLRYVYRGYNYIVEDWLVTSKMPESIELEENMFVPVIKNPRAVALTSPKLKEGESSRLLVVRLARGA